MAPKVGIKWPADAVERRAVADLVPYARNARTHSKEQVDQIAASIRKKIRDWILLPRSQISAAAVNIFRGIAGFQLSGGRRP